jgi:hypothetical protein
MKGDATDFTRANKAAGFRKTPPGYTWHHVEDGKTMLLVPTDIHESFPHTGGASPARAGRRYRVDTGAGEDTGGTQKIRVDTGADDGTSGTQKIRVDTGAVDPSEQQEAVPDEPPPPKKKALPPP